MQFIKIGIINNTHALKGELKVRCLNGRYRALITPQQNLYFYDQKNYTYEMLKIAAVTEHQKNLIVKFDGYHHINDVIFLKNHDLFYLTDDEDLINETNFQNFIGCKVKNINDEALVGVVIDYFTTKAHGVFVIETTTGAQKLLANVPNFVINIIWSQRTIFIKLIDNW